MRTFLYAGAAAVSVMLLTAPGIAAPAVQAGPETRTMDENAATKPDGQGRPGARDYIDGAYEETAETPGETFVERYPNVSLQNDTLTTTANGPFEVETGFEGGSTKSE